MSHKPREFKRWHMYLLIIMIVVAIGYKLYSSIWPKGIVVIGGETISVLVANNFPHLYKGWSDRDSMGEYGGMLFVFLRKDQHAMVMRNMRFPLDIVWLNGNTIVDIAPNAVPEPGRSESQLTPYFARLPSTFVLELPAGFTSKYGVKVGDTIKLSY